MSNNVQEHNAVPSNEVHENHDKHNHKMTIQNSSNLPKDHQHKDAAPHNHNQHSMDHSMEHKKSLPSTHNKLETINHVSEHSDHQNFSHSPTSAHDDSHHGISLVEDINSLVDKQPDIKTDKHHSVDELLDNIVPNNTSLLRDQLLHTPAPILPMEHMNHLPTNEMHHHNHSSSGKFFLFQSFSVETYGYTLIVIACILGGLLAVIIRLIRKYSDKYALKNLRITAGTKQQNFLRKLKVNLIQGLLISISLGWDYVLMMAVMSWDSLIVFGVLFGVAFGIFSFGHILFYYDNCSYANCSANQESTECSCNTKSNDVSDKMQCCSI